MAAARGSPAATARASSAALKSGMIVVCLGTGNPEAFEQAPGADKVKRLPFGTVKPNRGGDYYYYYY